MATSNSKVVAPGLIKFALTELTVITDQNKWSAKCAVCKQSLLEKRETTSAFTK